MRSLKELSIQSSNYTFFTQQKCKLMDFATETLELGYFVPMMKLALPIVCRLANAMATGSLQSAAAWSVGCNFCFNILCMV